MSKAFLLLGLSRRHGWLGHGRRLHLALFLRWRRGDRHGGGRDRLGGHGRHHLGLSGRSGRCRLGGLRRNNRCGRSRLYDLGLWLFGLLASLATDDGRPNALFDHRLTAVPAKRAFDTVHFDRVEDAHVIAHLDP